MSKKSLQSKIDALERAIKSPATSAEHKTAMQEQLKKLRNELDNSKSKPEKAEKKSAPVKLDRGEKIDKAGTVFLQELTDLGIDLDGEEETIVAGTRLELEDAYTLHGAARTSEITRIINELDDTWLEDIETDSVRTEIKKSINKFWKSVGKMPLDSIPSKKSTAVKAKKAKENKKPKRKITPEECREILAETEARRKKFKAAGRKYRTKPVSEKIASNIATATKQAIDNIPAEKLKDDPKGMFKKIESLEKSANQFFSDFRSVLGEDYDKSDAAPELKKISQLISDLKKKYSEK